MSSEVWRKGAEHSEKFIPGFLAYITAERKFLYGSQNSEILAELWRPNIAAQTSVIDKLEVEGMSLSYSLVAWPTKYNNVFAVAAVLHDEACPLSG